MTGMQNKISSILTYKNKSVFSNKYIYLWIGILFNSSTHNKCKSVYDLNITVRHLIYSVSVKCTMYLSQQSLRIVTPKVLLLFLKRLIMCVHALLPFFKNNHVAQMKALGSLSLFIVNLNYLYLLQNLDFLITLDDPNHCSPLRLLILARSQRAMWIFSSLISREVHIWNVVVAV